MTRRQPRTFYTSDLHLGHEKVAALRGFPSAVEHDRALEDAWRALVQPEDTVYVLGDVTGTASARTVQHALAVLRTLPGIKHLIAGNHDAVHPMHRRTFARWMPVYLSTFDTVTPFLRRKIGGHEVLLSHFPYASYGEGPHRGGTEASRHDQYRLPDMGVPIIHGHTHQPERSWSIMSARSWATEGKPPTRGIHVGLDAWDLAPVDQDAVIGILDDWSHA